MATSSIVSVEPVPGTNLVEVHADGPQPERLDGLAPHIDQAGLTLVRLRRDWDRAFHPHADKGFFKLKKKIPAVLEELGLR